MTDSPTDTDVDALRRRVTELEILLGQERSARAQALGKPADVQILEHLPYAVLIQRYGRIVYANPTAGRLHGVASGDALTGRDSLEFVRPEDHSLMVARRLRMTRNDSLQHRRLRVDGSEFIARLRSSEVEWQGAPATLVVMRDNTARANDRMALIKGEKRYRDLIEGSSFGIQISRLSGERLFVNQRFVDMFRYESAEELLSITEAGALVAPHDREALVARRRARERGESAADNYEYDALRKDGTFMPVQVFFRRVYWEGEEAFQRTMIDITPRREAERAQRESEEHYRHLAELSPDGILVNTDGMVVFANMSLATIIGAGSPDELIGTRALDLIPAENHEESLARRKKALEGQAVDRREGAFLRKDGAHTHVERAVKPISWQGKPSTLVLVRDINQRKRADATLQEQKGLLETVMNSMDPTLCAWDKDMKLVVWNRKWEEERKCPDGFLKPGLSYEEIMRLGFETGRYQGDDVEAAIAQRMAELRREIAPETVLEQPDGKILLRKRHPLPDGGYVSTHIDITEVTKAQNSLRESEERYRSLIEVVPEAVLVVDSGVILFCNPAANSLFGAEDAEKLIGMNHLDLMHPDSRVLVTDRVKPEAAEAPVTTALELRSFRLDGQEIITEIFSAPYRWNGRAVRLVLIRDITERKKIEAERERMLAHLLEAQSRIEEQSAELQKMAENSDHARREAQAANQAKSEFLALMSHELRTPLNAVLGFSEIISTEAFGPLGTRKYGEYARDIFNSGQHLLDLINDILDLSKVESGKGEIYDEEIYVPGLVSQLIPLVNGRAERGGVLLEYDCPEELPRLRADRRKVKQILVNLLSNAIKFTTKGGKVKFRTECRSGAGFVFQIVDTGIGIAPDDIPKAMSPFRQVESELNRTVEGTGLGLPLSKALVELHGGTLRLESQVGVGTRVVLNFPPERTVQSPSAADAGTDRRSA